MDDASLTVRADTVVASDGLWQPGQVTVAGGRVASVGAADPGAPVDAALLVPGFVDLQVNGIGDVDVAGARGADWDRLDDRLLAQGVTTWCPTVTTAPLPALAEALAAVSEARARPGRPRPTIAGAHLEGPFLTVAGAHPPELLRDSVDVDWLARQLPSLAVVTLAPELPGATEAIGLLSASGVVAALGHSACRAEEAWEAAEAGARLVTHLGNASGPFHQRRPGLLGAALAHPELAVSLIADLVHLHPLFVRAVAAAKGPGRTVLVTDAVAAEAGTVGPVVLDGTDRGPGRAARLSDGTLAGSVLTMPEALAHAVEAGVDLAAAVAAAATAPAAVLGLDDRGAISPGRRADLVALDGAGTVRAVWLAGRRAWPR